MQWCLQQCILQPQFPSLVLFTDQYMFTTDGILNLHDMHVWADENLHAQVYLSHEHRFSVNVWAGIIGDHIIGPYLLPISLTGPIYLTFIRDVLPNLLDVVPLQVQQVMWLQHERAPAHFDRNVQIHINVAFLIDGLVKGDQLQGLHFHLICHLSTLFCGRVWCMGYSCNIRQGPYCTSPWSD